MKGRKIRLGAVAFRILLQELIEGDRTYAELVDATGIGRETLGTWIQELRAHKLVYVSDWCATVKGRLDRPAFSFALLGTERDLPRQARLTSAQRQARYKAKQKQKRLLAAGVELQLPIVNRLLTGSL